MKKNYFVPVFLLMALMTSCGPKPAEELDDPVGADDTVSFTNKHDIETGYVKVKEVASRDYRLEYSNDGKSFETICRSQSEPIYCFDEYGDIYFHMEDASTNEVKKYSVNTKEYKTIFEDKYIQALSYDYDNSVLYLHYYDDGYKLLTLGGETQKEYSISELKDYMKFFAVKNNDIYFVYESKDTNTLYKYTMNISDTEIKLENEQMFAFPDNVKTVIYGNEYIGNKSENVSVNDMILLDDDIYMAVGMGKEDYTKYDGFKGWKLYSTEYVAESRGCILKFNLLNNKFDVTGLSENKRELSSGEYNLYGGDGFISCFSMSDMHNYDANKLYLDEGKTNPATFKIKMTCYGPELEDSDLGYVHNFAAIKPKKLVFTQGKNFIYVDGDGSFDCKKINAYSSIDLSTFAIDGSLEKIDETNFDFRLDNCTSFPVFDDVTTLYYGENESKQFQSFSFYK